MPFEEQLAVVTGWVAGLPPIVPALVGAALLLALGWVLALLARRWSRAIARRIVHRLRGAESSVESQPDLPADSRPGHVGRAVYWVVILFFAALAVHVLGVPLQAAVPGQIAQYAPSVILAVLTVLAGLLIARLAQRAVVLAARKAGIASADALGLAAYACLLLLTFVIAVEELGVNARLLEVLIALVVGITLAALGLAFGLGARGEVSNRIAARRLAGSIEVGQRIRVGDLTGRIVQLTETTVFLEVPDGLALVPASRFDAEPLVVLGTEE